MRNNILFIFFFSGALVLIQTGPAHAYIDPGMGSMLLQVILGGIAGAMVFFKLYWKKLKIRFSFFSRPDPKQDQEGHNEQKAVGKGK